MTASLFPTDRFTSAYDAFRATAEARPDNAFLCIPPHAGRDYHPDGAEFTYAEAAAEVERLRQLYQRSGIGHGHRVAALLGKNVEYVEKKIARGDNAFEHVAGDIPVYLAYFTAWPDQNGAVHYYNDIYTRDAHLKTALEKTKAARKNG